MTDGWRRRAGITGALAGLALAACASERETAPPTGSSRGAVTNGDLSTEASAVNLAIPRSDGSMGQCSGVLVTPSFVLTAAHCVNGSDNLVGDDTVKWDESKDIEVRNGSGQLIGRHTGFADHDPVSRFTNESPLDFSSPKAFEKDFALIPLDERVTTNQAQVAKLPFSPTGVPDDCSQSFDGEYIGFSDGPQKSGFHEVTYNPLGLYGQTYLGQFDGVTYFLDAVPTVWEAFVAASAGQQLLEHGDSGGPLLQPSAGFKLCGVNSGSTVSISCDLFFVCTIQAANVHAKLDRPIIASWFLSKTVDSTGTRFKGTCDQGPAWTQNTDLDHDTIPDGCDPCPRYRDYQYDLSTTPDTDEDGVPDRCDNCPTIANPPLRTLVGGQWIQYELTASDVDGDGIGDACDWCPTQPSSNQLAQNCNYETEMALHYPGLTAPPVIKETSPTKAAELAKYKQAFRVGTCEEAPCPAITLSDQAAGQIGTLPPGKQPTGACVNTATGKPCVWAAKNVLVHGPIPSPATEGLTGSVHTKWCFCDLPAGRSTAEGRRACRLDQVLDCEALDTRFLDPRWLDLTTTDLGNSNWNPATSAISTTETAAYAFEPATVRRRRWDYTALPFVTYDGNLPKVDGVLWNSVRTFPTYAFANPALDDRLRERGNSLESGDARVSPLGGGSGFPVPAGDGGLDDECWPCGFGLSSLLIDPTNVFDPALPVRVLKPTPSGSVVVELDAALAQLLKDGGRGTRTIVPASEPAGWVESRRPGTPELRGIALETNSARPTRLVISSFGEALQAVPIARVDAAPQEALTMAALGVGAGPLDTAELAPQSIPDPNGLALSASRKELWMIGGVAAGAAAPEAWRFDLISNRWTPITLRETGRISDVLAATYDPVADKLIALHRRGSTFQLATLDRNGSAFEPVLSLPPPWKSFDVFWLRSDGRTLVLAASRAGSARLARLDSSGKMVGLVLPHGIVGRPLLTPKGVAVIPEGKRNGDPKVELIPAAWFKPLPPGWCPKD